VDAFSSTEKRTEHCFSAAMLSILERFLDKRNDKRERLANENRVHSDMHAKKKREKRKKDKCDVTKRGIGDASERRGEEKIEIQSDTLKHMPNFEHAIPAGIT